MTIKVTNCSDCIFRNSHTNYDGMGYDTHDSCILLTKLKEKLTTIAVYDTWTKNKPKELEQRLPNCPLDKEQIIVTL